MEPPSPARLYAALLGAVLFVAGILGFFHDLSWLNYLYVASGTAGLFLAGISARTYALCAGLAYAALAIADFSNRGWPHLAIGLLGLAAFASTRDGSRRLKPRAKAAAKGP